MPRFFVYRFGALVLRVSHIYSPIIPFSGTKLSRTLALLGLHVSNHRVTAFSVGISVVRAAVSLTVASGDEARRSVCCDGASSASNSAILRRRRRASGLRIKAKTITMPSSTLNTEPSARTTSQAPDAPTTTREYATPAMTSNLGLNTSDRSLKTPPRRSIAMNGMEMPLTSWYLYIS